MSNFALTTCHGTQNNNKNFPEEFHAELSVSVFSDFLPKSSIVSDLGISLIILVQIRGNDNLLEQLGFSGLGCSQ